jgi:hypothetical protein
MEKTPVVHDKNMSIFFVPLFQLQASRAALCATVILA